MILLSDLAFHKIKTMASYMKLRNLLLILLLIIAFTLFATIAFALPTAKITAHVTDENGLPIKDAEVWITFMMPNKEGVGLGTQRNKGFSDSEGIFTTKGEGLESVSVSSRKEGYYKSGVGYKFKDRNLLGRWEPWNPTIEVVLKKKRNPVPMYAQKTQPLAIPLLDQPIGYDFEIGDWVTPHGNGNRTDLLFTCIHDFKAYRDAEFSCSITFSNEKDGVQEFVFKEDEQSYYKWPFEAPIEGYNHEPFKKWMSIHQPNEGYKSNINKNANYIFRVRSETDEKGNISKANYGKIYGDFAVSRSGHIQFTYYFNPDGTRNLEFDMKKNLFNWSRDQREREVNNP